MEDDAGTPVEDAAPVAEAITEVIPERAQDVLSKYGNDPEKIAAAYAALERKLGEQGVELGELRRLVEGEYVAEEDADDSGVYDWQSEQQAWTPDALTPDQVEYLEQVEAANAAESQAELEQVLAQSPPEFVEFVGSPQLDEMLSMELYAPDARMVVAGNTEQKVLALARLFVANEGRNAQALSDASRTIARQTAVEQQQMVEDAFVVSQRAPVTAEEKTWAQQEAEKASHLFQKNASMWADAASWTKGRS